MTDSSKSTLERVARRIPVPEPAYERLLRRRDRRRRNQRIASGSLGIVVFVVAVGIATGWFADRSPTPAIEPTPPPEPDVTIPAPRYSLTVPEADYLLDLDTGAVTLLSESVFRLEGPASGYAVSRDGSRLAYVASDGAGERQIFVTDVAGTEQVTRDGVAGSPSWSPDGSMIAYIGHMGGGSDNVFVLDLTTGASTQLTFHSGSVRVSGGPASFSPDGSSLVYQVDRPLRDGGSEVRIVPVAGSESTRLAAGGGVDRGFSQLSPDGSLLSYDCEALVAQDPTRMARGVCVSNTDGTNARVLFARTIDAIPSVRWSPDGTRLAFSTFHSFDVFGDVSVADVATGPVTHVGEGASPTWVDDHTLLVEIDGCLDPVGGYREGCAG